MLSQMCLHVMTRQEQQQKWRSYTSYVFWTDHLLEGAKVLRQSLALVQGSAVLAIAAMKSA